MNDFSEILDGPGYFFCEKTNCKLRISVCIQRQEANKKKAIAETPFMVCEDCPQGMENVNPLPKGDLKLSEEERKNRQSPEALTLEKAEPQPNLCEDCGKKPRMGSSPYCASCMGTRGNRAKAIKKAAKELKIEKKAKAQAGSETAARTANTALEIEFGKHVSILRDVERLAEHEIRSVECQVIYMLKQQLREKEVAASQ